MLRASLLTKSMVALAVAVLAGATVCVRPVHACGGLFSEPTGPVNLAAWRIVFADDGQGTITMAVEVRYDGPPEQFAWLLPVAGVPELRVTSTTAFDRLQAATDPRYTLRTRVEGSCDSDGDGRGSIDAGGAGAGGGGGVEVAAQGTVGPYVYTVLSLDPELEDAAQVATDWLDDNGYRAPDGAAALVRPYLEDGLNLLAFRLDKDRDTGAIRPIMIAYDAELPSIPLTLGAVAANDDVGILVWVLSDARAFPSNYKSLELNEALIDWFDPARSYDEVVSAAADEAGGQGFVTELARRTEGVLDGVVYGAADENGLNALADATDDLELVALASASFGSWDGFIELMRARVTPPDGITLEDFLSCVRCSRDSSGFAFEGEGFEQALLKDVVQPMRDMQALLDSRPYLTRMYTTMSAREMTSDPVFDFDRGELGDVSNMHEAERVVECASSITRDEAPYRIVLPQGDVVRGNEAGRWPIEIDDGQPAARRILALSASGDEDVVQDNRERIADLLAAHNATVPGPPAEDCGCRTPGATRGSSWGAGALASALLGAAVSRRRRRLAACGRRA